jgi:hypothetical protein
MCSRESADSLLVFYLVLFIQFYLYFTVVELEQLLTLSLYYLNSNTSVPFSHTATS